MIVGPRLFYILLCGGFFFFTTNAETVPASPLNCDPDEWFKCLDGICVMRSWLCDGEPDCLDGSDEVDCPAVEQKDQAERSEQSMIHDGEDFVETGFGHCNLTTEFQCNETILCIPRYWICDGNNDCTDNSDEEAEMCETYKNTLHCEDEMFFCNDKDKKCIPERWKCDDKPDCPNGYDEDPSICNKTLTNLLNCSKGYECKSTNESIFTCLPLDRVCNGKSDCPEGDDEGPKCTESCNDVHCQSHQKCHGKPEGTGLCLCDEGYKMLNDSTCTDINECDMIPPPCSQTCANTDGGFYCLCQTGYKLDHLGNCKAAYGKPATLLFSGISEIRSREIPSNDHYTLITNDYKYVKQAIGVAFDPSERRIYWSDAYLQQIVSSNMAGMDFRSWNHTQMHKPEFLAIDYAERNIYYSDSINKSISVCTIDGNYCQGVITEGIVNPRGIAVYPPEGILAYSNWADQVGQHPHIGLSGMDGGDLKILVETKILWPNGIAFDMPSRRLFWGEAYYDILESIKLDGTGRIAMKPAPNFVTLHPFSLAVFEDTIYWSDFSLQEIQSCHKFTGKNHQVIVKSGRLKTYGIEIVHKLLEPPMYSPNIDKRCSHMSLLKKGGQEVVCRCPNGYKMKNGHTCVGPTPSWSTAVTSPSTSTAVTSPSTTTPQSSTVTTTSPGTTSVSTANDTSQSEDVVPSPVANDTSQSEDVGPSPVANVVAEGHYLGQGPIIGIVFGILCLIAIIVVVFCCWCKPKIAKLPPSPKAIFKRKDDQVQLINELDHPPEGILAYSNWAEQNPHIGLSGKDGGDLKSIVVENYQNHQVDTKYYEVL